MEDYQIMQLGRIFASVVEAMGMQAENMQRATLGESMAYTDNDFHNMAEEIKHLANELR
jgi:cytidylate kinase